MRILFICVFFSSLIGCGTSSKANYRAPDNFTYSNKGSSQTIPSGTRIYQTDSIGNIQYHKQQHQVVGDRIYQVDSIGNIQHHKPSVKIK